MNNKISVIVPVYNIEQYIHRCVNSILAQTYPNIEIIIVDDGSTDNSGRIIDDIASTNSSIRVLHKKNGGVSSAAHLLMYDLSLKHTIFSILDQLHFPFRSQVGKASHGSTHVNVCSMYEREFPGHAISVPHDIRHSTETAPRSETGSWLMPCSRRGYADSA